MELKDIQTADLMAELSKRGYNLYTISHVDLVKEVLDEINYDLPKSKQIKLSDNDLKDILADAVEDLSYNMELLLRERVRENIENYN